MEYIYHRIFGYSFTLLLHGANLTYLALYIPPEVFETPNLIILRDLQPRYFTIWTVIVQILYASISLICELMSLMNSRKKNYELPKYLRRFRDVLFSSILWPSTWVVAVFFWTLYNYDTSLIFPKYTEKMLTPVSNHIMHSFIVPVAIWELLYRRRREPKTHIKYFCHLLFHFFLYFIVITYTFIERGIWIYPIFTNLYGTIYFPLIHLVISLLAMSAYFIQWPLAEYIWQRGVKKVV